ncbi:MAG: hypothetical protein JKY23_00365 [Nitrospinaceae bacterium]|nr:hypothetical protein [Nitrospinaceae bacterium]
MWSGPGVVMAVVKCTRATCPRTQWIRPRHARGQWGHNNGSPETEVQSLLASESDSASTLMHTPHLRRVQRLARQHEVEVPQTKASVSRTYHVLASSLSVSGLMRVASQIDSICFALTASVLATATPA